MSLDLWILLICGFAIALLGLVIFIRNPHESNNQRFAFLAISTVIWSTFNYLSDHADKHVLLFTRLTILGGIAAIYSVLIFIENFPGKVKFKNSLVLTTHLVFTIALAPIVFLPQFIMSVTLKQSGGSVNTSYLYWTFILYVLFSFILLVIVLVKQYRTVKSNVERQQLSILSWGISIYAVLAVTSNVGLPLVIKSWSSSRFGPAFTLVLVSVVGYTIIRHHLFDIKLIVARSVAYTLTLTTVALIFIAPTIIVTTYFIHQSLKPSSVIVLVVVTFVVAIIFQPIRNKFNKLTNSIFYRDYYEAQEVLDKLSNLLVGSVDTGYILKGSTSILSDAIRPQSFEFLLLTGSDDDHKKMDLLNLLNSSGINILITDELDRSKNSALYEDLRDKNIAAATRLRTPKEDLGFTLLGYKESGAIYNDNDKNLLGIAADEIAISLQNALRFEQIQKFNVTLQEKVDDATKQLTQANSRLKALDETKDDFISMASHQLRTPLSIIKGYVKMVSEGDAGKINSQQAGFLEQALVSSESMVRLVSELLNVSRITSGKFNIEEEQVNLADVVDELVGQIHNLAEEKDIKLTFEKPKDFPLMMLDKDKIEQVVINFIDNAIHYSKKTGAKIEVQLSAKDDIVFKVIDNGIGVPEKEKAHMFTKFYRANNARDVRPDGTGVGIYLAKVVISEEGGDLIFESKEGEGSTFGFRFKKDKIVRPKNTAE